MGSQGPLLLFQGSAWSCLVIQHWSLKQSVYLSFCLSVGGQVAAGLREGQHRAGISVGDQGGAAL